MTDWFTEEDVINACAAYEDCDVTFGHRKAMRAALSAVRPNEWRTIKSAPKDGTKIDICGDNQGKIRIVDVFWVGFWAVDGLFEDEVIAIGVEPTHWMPRPTPPEAE